MSKQEGTITIHAGGHTSTEIAYEVGRLVAEMMKGPMLEGGAVRVSVAIEHDPEAKVSA